MNCQLCQKELEAYREGKLPEGIRNVVEVHLESCKDCSKIFKLLNLADKIISEEKGLQSNPFLSTRIMTGIEKLEQKQGSYIPIPIYQKVLKPALISISIAAAIFIGVLSGNIYKPTKPTIEVPDEMVYMNDAALESFNIFSNE